MRKDGVNHDVMTTREAAEQLGVALRTVQLWVESGVLPAWKTAGGHRRVARQAVEALKAQRRQALDAAPATATPSAAPERFRMLVVEDEPDLLALFRAVIEDWELPIELATAANGFEALVKVGQMQPDLLVTDLNMPGMDGFRMIRSLRQPGTGLPGLEIVAVTALGSHDIADRGGLPADVRVFRKPVPFSDLEHLVRERIATRNAVAA